MGGVLAFVQGWRRRQAAARGGAAGVDPGGEFLQVIGVEQFGLGNRDEIRIAQEAAVAIGAAQHFHHVVGALHAVGLAPGQLLQHRQALGQGDAAGRGRRGADQFAAIGEGKTDRLAFHGFVVGQVAQAPDAASGIDARNQFFRDGAAVETGLAIAGHAFQGVGQLRLAQQAELFRHLALVVEEQAGGLAVVAHGRQAPGGAFTVDAIHRNAVAGQADRRGQAVGQRQPAIVPGEVRQGCREAWDGGGQGAVQGKGRVNLAVAHVEAWMGGRRRALTGVEEPVDGLFAGPAKQEETAAAQAGPVRLGNGKGSADGHRGVEGVAALGQGFQAGHGGRRVGCGDRRAARLGGLHGAREQKQRGEQRAAIGAANRAAHGSGLAGELQVLLHQLILAFDIGFVEGNAVDGADLLTLRLVVVADAFRAQVGIDHIDFLALGNRTVGALGFADVAVDAVVGDLEGHGNNSCRRQAAAALNRK
ncbi:hypothetical protein D9M71_323780 [compost metagenome]